MRGTQEINVRERPGRIDDWAAYSSNEIIGSIYIA
jgi:hypothetical protein